MSAKTCSFFMGANTKDGFVSLFDQLRAEDAERRIYAVKSGPGCGKSTCIKNVAGAFLEQAGFCEYLYCSSDPGSLDGAILDGCKLALVDGTAPHVFDPAFPGAEGGYIAFPPFLKLRELEAKYPRLRELSLESKAHYGNAYRLIHASWRVDETIRSILEPNMPAGKLRRRADGIITREIPKKGGKGQLRLRLLDGITPDGLVCLYDTVDALASRVYDFCDSFGFAPQMLEPIRDAALARGYTVYACMCPKNPNRLLHVLIPELNLAFVTSNDANAYPGKPFRRIRIDSYLQKEGVRPHRGKIKLLGKVSASLMEDAVAEILSAHKLHDVMEELYRPHIDIAGLNRVTQDIIHMIAK